MAKVSPDDSQVVKVVREATLSPQLSYYPTEEQRLVKARFWKAFKANPLTDVVQISPAQVEEMTGHSVQKWLGDKAFWPWFSRSKDTTGEYLEVAAEKAGELAMHFLNPAIEFNDNARVALMKLVLEYSGRAPASRKEVKWHDKEVAELNEDQLDALIDKLSRKKLSSPPNP